MTCPWCDNRAGRKESCERCQGEGRVQVPRCPATAFGPLTHEFALYARAWRWLRDYKMPAFPGSYSEQPPRFTAFVDAVDAECDRIGALRAERQEDLIG